MKKFCPVFLGLFIIILDQVIKGWVRKIPFFITNNQYIFGLFRFPRLIFTWIILLFVLLLMWFRKNELEKNWFCFCLIIAGAISNLLDRSIWGGVIDYLGLNIKNFHLNFNLADILIVLGFVIYATRKIKENHNQISRNV